MRCAGSLAGSSSTDASAPGFWDAKGKTFRGAPLHSWASHYADALRTFAVGYREPREVNKQALPKFALSNTARRDDSDRSPWGRS